MNISFFVCFNCDNHENKFNTYCWGYILFFSFIHPLRSSISTAVPFYYTSITFLLHPSIISLNLNCKYESLVVPPSNCESASSPWWWLWLITIPIFVSLLSCLIASDLDAQQYVELPSSLVSRCPESWYILYIHTNIRWLMGCHHLVQRHHQTIQWQSRIEYLYCRNVP